MGENELDNKSSEITVNDGEKPVDRNEKGQFIDGNKTGGTRKGSISITSSIKKELKEIPVGSKETYLILLIKRILQKAIVEGDVQLLKQIWAYIDGQPKQTVRVEDDEEMRIMKEQLIKALESDGPHKTIQNKG